MRLSKSSVVDVDYWFIVIFLAGARWIFPMIYLRGKIFILGGWVGTQTSSVLVSSDNGTNWEEAAPLASPRWLHTAVTTETLPCN